MWEALLCLPYNRNSTSHMRSDTNITNLGWNNILRKNEKITNLQANVSENPRGRTRLISTNQEQN